MPKFQINVTLTFDEEIESDGDREYRYHILEKIHVEHDQLAGFDETELAEINEALQDDRYQIALSRIGSAIEGEVIDTKDCY